MKYQLLIKTINANKTKLFITFIPSDNVFIMLANVVVFFNSLHLSQQFFSHVWTGIPGFNQYLAEDKVSCSK